MNGIILEQVFLGNKISDYLISAVALLASFMVINIFKRHFIKRLKKIAERTTTTVDDFLVKVIEKLAVPFLYLVAVYTIVKNFALHPYVERGMNYLGFAVVIVFVARFVIMLVGYGFKIYLAKNSNDVTLEHSLQGVLIVIKVLVWGGAIIFSLDNLGFKISAIIAGLGIGGVAVALAAQTILKDLFSYFSIIFDQPFKVGDFIIVGDYMGTIEYIGIKTTRIRSLGGEMLVFSNSDLTDSRLRNYKLMEKRRVVFKLGVVYQVPTKQLKELPKIIEGIIKNTKDAVFDRAHFCAYGDFSLIFEVVYYVVGSDYNKYMDVQQEINFSIKEEFEKRGIEFAYPTQTLYVNKN
ncbi:MAG: mechanosensitive ion channel family protein [Candidatus Omnitrophica bacterium]|nr:mechanosensitive ion channel family protein [Candidatus Omnitrophota bacterium]MDD5691336.1 mechanosensitive ion channel family protein [Candidatus Omnitrophota bacterium]